MKMRSLAVAGLVLALLMAVYWKLASGSAENVVDLKKEAVEKQVSHAPVRKESEPAKPEKQAPAIRHREALKPERSAPEKAASGQFAAQMVEKERSGYEAKIGREMKELKRVVSGLSADQEQKITAQLRRGIPQISEKDGSVYKVIQGEPPALNAGYMKEVYDSTLNAKQRSELDGLLEGRKRSKSEADATRSYASALEKLPDLNEDQKNALNDYYRKHAGNPPPRREQQQQELAGFLSPEDIEALGNTHRSSGMVNLNGVGEVKLMNLESSKIPEEALKVIQEVDLNGKP